MHVHHTRKLQNRVHAYTQQDHSPCGQCNCLQNQEGSMKSKLRSSLSRSKSRQKGRKGPLGVMERNVYQNLDYYKTLNATTNTRLHTTHHDQQQDILYASLFPSEAELKPKPQITEKSKKLYEKVRRERRLSPNVFDRLQADEEQRSRSKVVSIIQRIREVTPTKKLTRNDLQKFSTPKQMRYFEQYLNLPPPE